MKKGLVSVLSMATGIVLGAIAIDKVKEKTLEHKQSGQDRYKAYYNMLNQWIELKQKGIPLERYFNEYGYQSIAIYGMGEMGNRLYEELKDTNIEVKYAVDQNTDCTDLELKVVDKDSISEKADVMVVTAVYAYQEIEEELQSKVTFPIVALDDIIYELNLE